MTEAQRAAARQRTREWRAKPENKLREAATKQAWKEAHPDEWHARKRTATAAYNERNRAALRAKANAVRAELRAEAIAAYGGRCNCEGCHVSHAELLTVDHVGGDGAGHRRRLGRSTRDFYRWLKAHGYPSDFQLLCGSGNLAKSDRERCPLSGVDH